MSIPQYTTPTFVLTFSENDVNLTSARNVYVTFTSPWYSLTKTGEDLIVENTRISVFLTQEETAQLRSGEIEIQANWTLSNGFRAASEITKYEISRQLLKKVIE